MEGNLGYVVAGYVVTALVLGGYTARLFARMRAARRRAEAVSARRSPRDGAAG
jgi:hypothetical protein